MNNSDDEFIIQPPTSDDVGDCPREAYAFLRTDFETINLRFTSNEKSVYPGVRAVESFILHLLNAVL